MPSAREIQLARQAMAAGITSREELANFMAQIGHESGGLTRLNEGFRYTRGIEQIPVRSALRQGSEALERARLEALDGRPDQLAELMYGGRMGNIEPGDGHRFHGRGYIQLTGRDNYRTAGEALDLDLTNHPELAAEPENAARIAVWFWRQRVPEAAREDVTDATRAINGGTNGLADRETRYDEWHRLLTPEYMQQIAAGTAVPNAGADATHNADRVNINDGLLRQRERSGDIRDLQQSLNQLGVRDARGRTLVEDGDYGQRTREAVEAFQRANGLKVDGIAGPDTLARIGERLPQRGTVTATAEITGLIAAQPRTLADPGHPRHTLYRQAYDGLQGIDPQRSGLRSEQELRNAAGTLAFEARVSGLTRIDHVVANRDGSGLFAVQGRINDPSHHRIYVDRAQAAAQPLEAARSSWSRRRSRPNSVSSSATHSNANRG